MISKDIQKLLRDHQIDISLKDGSLAVRSAGGALDESLLSVLRANKSALIAWLSGSESEGGARTQIRPEARRATVAPASRSQQALWAIGQLGAGGDQYNIPLRADISGPVNVLALGRSVTTLGARHDALRTLFRMQDGSLQQIVTDARLELSVCTEGEGEQTLSEIQSELFDAPFDLQAGPLFRARLVHLNPEMSVLLLCGHHMILDGASLGILIEELRALYQAEVSGGDAALSPPSFQYSDFADWQHRLAASPDGDRSNRYWQESLAHAPVVHGLPLDAPRAGQPSFDGDRMSRELPQEKSSALLALAARMNTTPFVLMLAAFGLVIARHSNESDLVISMPVANRHRPEFAKTVGFLANVLPLRLRVDATLSFAELVQATHQTVFGAVEHQDVPFERIVELVNPPRNLSHNPLSQIMISMDNFVSDRFSMHDLEVELGPLEDSGAKLDLALAIRVQNGIIGLHWNWASALFHRATIERFGAHFEQLLDSILTDPQAVAADLNMISADEHLRLMNFSIGETVEFDEDLLCHEIFERLARSQPDASAIRDANGILTYSELDQRADRVARHILQTVGPVGQPVGILCGRSAEFVIAQLAILKSNNVFVPIDPASPAARVHTIAVSAGMSLVLTGDSVDVPPLPNNVRILSLSAVPEPDGAVVAAPRRTGEDAAYIVFTSGSTGTPKGAVVPLRGLRYMTLPQVMRYEMTPETVMTVSANVAFDSILWEIWPTLVSGGCLVMTPDAALADPALLSRHICQHRPTHFWLPTGMLELFCSLNLEWPDSIRMVFTGGDRLLRNCLPDTERMKLVNIYGPTECSVWATCHDVLVGGPEPAPIGRPLFNTATFVMDQGGRLLPQGAIGEIVIAGKGIGSGYLGREDLTQKAFLTLRDHPTGYRQFYRSGDLGRWREDGTLDCLGRIDTQVKIRGFRVEPGEIASTIMAHREVANAFVLVDESGAEKRLVAFVVAEAGGSAGLGERLRQSLAQAMPNYMVPSRIILLDSLPLTPNGKIDRRELVAIAAQQFAAGQVNTASPRDDLELSIYKIWRETLLNDRIGIRDNFFDVGGTSISAIKVVAAINAELRTNLQISDLFHNTTIEDIAALIRGGLGATRVRSPLIDLKRGEGSANVVCVHPAGGTAFCYLSLAKLLPQGVGVFGLQAPGVDDDAPLLPDLTAMALHQIAQIKHLLDRPLVLTGASFGGLLGFEMVRLLGDAGHRRISIVMLDTEGIDDPDILARIKPVSAEVFREKLVRYNGMYPGIDQAQIDRYHRIYNHHLALQRDYVAQPNSGRCLLLQAADDTTAEDRREGQKYWARYCTGALTFHDSPGDHASMLETPAVDFVGGIISQELADL